MLTFNFNDIESSTHNIYIEKKPDIIIPQRRIEYIDVPGRDGKLSVDDETYDNIPLPIECTFDATDRNVAARNIKAWLTSGKHNLKFSDDTSVYYKAQLVNRIDIQYVLSTFNSFVLIFDCEPFQYTVSNNLISLTSAGNVTNSGTRFSLPKITVYGTGTITLTINGKSIILTNVSSYVTIDSDVMDCYKDTTLKNTDMTGEFPVLVPGVNAISWTGTVTKVDIVPNLRYI